MSAVTQGILKTRAEVLQVYLQRASPEVPGNQATPSACQRVLYKLRRMKSDLVEAINKIEESKRAMNEYLGKQAKEVAARKEVELTELITQCEVDQKIKQAYVNMEGLQTKIDKLEDRLDLTPSEAGTQVTATAPAPRMAIRKNLPRTELRTFDGDPVNWIPFWDQFRTLIHEDEAIPRVEKFSYLESIVEGRAHAVIAGIPLSENGYDDAIELLLRTYGDSKKLIRNLNTELMKLPVSKNYASDEQLYLRSEKIFRQLLALRQNVEDGMYYANLEGKISPETLDKYCAIKDAEDNDDWNTTKFREAFSRALEQIKNRKELRKSALGDSYERESSSEQTMSFSVKAQSNWRDQKQEGGRWSPGPDRSRPRDRDDEERRQAWRTSPGRVNERRSWQERRRDSPNFVRDKGERRFGEGSRRQDSSSPEYNGRNGECKLCQGRHAATDCRRYGSVNERRKRVAQLKLCYVCLSSGHFAGKCNRQNDWCRICKRKGHHVALCLGRRAESRSSQSSGSSRSQSPGERRERMRTNTTQETEGQMETETNISAAMSCLARERNKVSLLKCTKVTIYNPLDETKRKEVLVFLDDGSQRSYIEQDLANELQLEPMQTQKFELTGLQGIKLGSYVAPKYEIGISSRRFEMLMRCCALDKVLKEMPVVKLNHKVREQLQRSRIKVPKKFREPKLIIGNDYYNRLRVCVWEKLNSGFYINDSRIGKFLSGLGKLEFLAGDKEERMKSNENSSHVILEEGERQRIKTPRLEWMTGSTNQGQEDTELQMEMPDASITQDEFGHLVKRMSNLEFVGMADLGERGKGVREKMIDKISFNGERYQTELLWNEELANRLPTNYDLAFRQLKSNLERLQKRPDLMKKIHEIIQEQVRAGFVEECEPLPVNERYLLGQRVHYLPHHPVVKESSEHTKIRIVYNASAKKINQPALNEVIEKGENEYNDLAGILIRARLTPILLTSDIAKAFHQILIHPKDRDAMRFLWVRDPMVNKSEIVEYRFTRVTFGVICSPAHLALVIKIHLSKYDDPLTRQIEKDVYVDNILTGIKEPKEVKQVHEKLKKIFADAGMNVREFVSNCTEEIQKLPAEDRIDKEVVKLLGLGWNVKEDTLKLSFPANDIQKLTRRKVLSQIAKVFDPNGLISPAILTAKLFRQSVENAGTKLKWDSLLSDKETEEWNRIMEKWSGRSIKVPRRVTTRDVTHSTKYELHAFADASHKAMGAAIYLRIIDGEEVNCALIFAKSLVVPMSLPEKKRTIPILELNAAALLGKFVPFVKTELEKVIKVSKTKMWTDSADVIDFLNSEKGLERYIRNRVEKLRTWRFAHVSGELNPADIASRGMSPDELQANERWWKGPEFLRSDEASWPTPIKEYDPDKWLKRRSEDKVVCEMSGAVTEVKKKQPKGLKINVERFSQWKRLRNTVAYLRRWYKGPIWLDEEEVPTEAMRGEVKPREGDKEKIAGIKALDARETKEAEICIFKAAQVKDAPDEESQRNLRIFEDEDGLLRSKGRIEEAEFDWETVNPIYLSHRSPIVRLLIREAHQETQHGRKGQMLSYLRKKFWIPKCRRTITSIVKTNKYTKCGICARLEAKPFSYPESPKLPKPRVKGSAFEAIGVDYFGPMTIKTAEGVQKVWGSIFACTLSRAIHLELVTDCSTERFILALERFMRRRRVPKLIISDNASNFVLAHKILSRVGEQELRKQGRWTATKHKQEELEKRAKWQDIWGKKEVKEFITNKAIEWQFATPQAPWRSGFYERLIGLVKHHLYRGLGKKLLSYEELETYLTQVERIVNERPLTYIEEDEIVKPLCPINILNASEGASHEYDENMGNEETENDPKWLEKETKRERVIEMHERTVRKSKQFWQAFQNDYLLALREREKGLRVDSKRFPTVGEVVIVKDMDPAPKNKWKLARIVEVKNDRTAKIRTAEGRVLERATALLYPLEIGGTEEMIKEGPQMGIEEPHNTGDENNDVIISGFTMEEELSIYDSAEGEEEEAEKATEPRREIRAPVALIGSERKVFDGLRELLQLNDARFIEVIPRIWDAKVFEEEIGVTESVQSMVFGHSKCGVGLMQVLVSAQRLYGSSKKLFWIVDEGQENKWPQLLIQRIKRIDDIEEMLMQMILNGMELVARDYGANRRKRPGLSEREALKRAKRESKESEKSESEKDRRQASAPATAKSSSTQSDTRKELVNRQFDVVEPTRTLVNRQFVAVEKSHKFVNRQFDVVETGPGTSRQWGVEVCSSEQPKRLEEKSPPWPRLIENEGKKIYVYFGGAFAFSNFHTADFTAEVNGKIEKFWNVEQYYCYHKARKFQMHKLAERIKNDPKMMPAEMKRACDREAEEWAKSEVNPIRYDQNVWNEVREDIMIKAMRAKFMQNETLKKILVGTGDVLIGEASRNGAWGIGAGLTDETEIKTGMVHGFRGRNLGGYWMQQWYHGESRKRNYKFKWE